MLKAKFILIETNPEYILIEDQSNQFNSMSVTNDAENVIENLFTDYGLTEKQIVYYISTDGSVDILNHINKEFTGFIMGYLSIEDFKKDKSKNDKIDYSEFITVSDKYPYKTERLLLRKNVSGYGYDLIDRIGKQGKWLFLLTAQTKQLCETANTLLLEFKFKEFEKLQKNNQSTFITNKILISKEKHGDRIFHVPTINDLHKVALFILEERAHIFKYIRKSNQPKQLDFTKDDIEKMPESFKNNANIQLSNYENNLIEIETNNKMYNNTVRALNENNGTLAWNILQNRNGYMYEKIELINPISL